MDVPKPGRPVRGSASGRPLMALLDAVGRKGALRVGWELRDGALGFRELQRRAEVSSPTLLAQRLREAGELGTIVKREDGRYELTAHGLELIEILAPLDDWARRWARRASRRGRRGRQG